MRTEQTLKALNNQHKTHTWQMSACHTDKNLFYRDCHAHFVVGGRVERFCQSAQQFFVERGVHQMNCHAAFFAQNIAVVGLFYLKFLRKHNRLYKSPCPDEQGQKGLCKNWGKYNAKTWLNV